MEKRKTVLLALLVTVTILVSACGDAATPTITPRLKVGVVIDAGSANDRSFNQYTLEGARRASKAAALGFSYREPQSPSDYEASIEGMIADGADVEAQNFISQRAVVIFAVGGKIGTGGLLAAHEANLMAIGVDLDQYFTYPKVAPPLPTSASKNVDVVALIQQ